MRRHPPEHPVKCELRHIWTTELVVINQAKGWARELEKHLKGLGKTFDEAKGDLTDREVALYGAVKTLRAFEGKGGRR